MSAKITLLAFPPLALLLVLLYTVLTPPFFGADELAHSERALGIAHGQWLTTKASLGETVATFPNDVLPQGAPVPTLQATAADSIDGTTVDTGFVEAAMAGTFAQRRFIAHHPDWTHRPDGRMPRPELAAERSVGWSRRFVFVSFLNTAVYPTPLYLPSALGWKLGEEHGLTIVHSLYLARAFDAVCAVALGWLALWLAGPDRFPLFLFLLFPVLLTIEASCSQDAVLLPLMAIAFALLTRTVAAHRTFLPWEWLSMVAIFALAIAARPPYLWMLVLLAIPSFEMAPGQPRRWLPVASAAFAVLLLVGWWRYLVRFVLLSHSAEASPPAQIAFVKAHPLRTFWVLLTATSKNIPGIVIRGAEVLEHRSAAGTVSMLAVTLLSAAILWYCCRGVTFRRAGSSAALLLAVVMVTATMALAEYIIWNPPSSHFVEGIQARYYLPLLPFTLLLRFPRNNRQTLPNGLPCLQPRWLAPVAAAVFLAASLYTPFFLAHRYYATGLFRAVTDLLLSPHAA